ncbi:MAG: aminotransferase class III-fold pyridoxal phosphate-dependent enzyme, partial [Halieaceae bacterium]|nr:aminotransferase class III-fold pyridoxal phosphate-dependent enzyme [Halieaceae bacterium]
TFSREILRKGRYVTKRLEAIVARYGEGNFTTRGRGMFQGINCVNGEIASSITSKAFEKGLIIETSGAEDHVVKFLCPLVISDTNLKRGIDIVEEAIRETCAREDAIPEEYDYFEPQRLAS